MLRLFVKRGVPSMIAEATAGVSPIASAPSASSACEPSGASMTSRSASRPTSTIPVCSPCSAATFPVAAATASAASTPPRDATHDTARSMPSGWTPDPAGLSVPITRRGSSPRRATSAATSPAAFTFPLWTISTRADVSSRIRST